jgi:hypothetical protein
MTMLQKMSVTIPKEAHRALRLLALKEDRSLLEVTRSAILEWIKINGVTSDGDRTRKGGKDER